MTRPIPPARFLIEWEPSYGYDEPHTHEGPRLTHNEVVDVIHDFREDEVLHSVTDMWSLEDVTDVFRPAPTPAERKGRAADRAIKEVKEAA